MAVDPETSRDTEGYWFAEDMGEYPPSVRWAIELNIVVTCWLPTVAMTISDVLLGRIPHAVVIFFGMAVSLLFMMMYRDTTFYPRSALAIHLQTFSTLAMYGVISVAKDWPLELVIAEVVLAEMLGFTLGILVLFLLPRGGHGDGSSNDSPRSRLYVFPVLLGLGALVAVVWFRFEGAIDHLLTHHTFGSPLDYALLGAPLVVVTAKYVRLCRGHLAGLSAQAAVEPDLFSLRFGVPFWLNGLVPLVMYLMLYADWSPA